MGKQRLEWLQQFVSSDGPGRQIQYIREGQVLFKKGDAASNLYWVLDGEVRLVTISPSGKTATHEICGPHHWLVEGPIDAQPDRHTHTAIATLDSSIMAFTRKGFRALLDEHPYLSVTLNLELTRQFCEVGHILDDHLIYSSNRRVARALLDMIADRGVDVMNVETTPTRIARLVGKTRQTGHKIIDKFVEIGILTKLSDKSYRIHRRPLEAFLTAADDGEMDQ